MGNNTYHNNNVASQGSVLEGHFPRLRTHLHPPSPRDLEKKNFPRIPTIRGWGGGLGGGKCGNIKYHHTMFASQSLSHGIGTPGVNLRFGPQSTLRTAPRPLCTFFPWNLENKSIRGIPTSWVPCPGGHSTTPMGCHQNLKPGTNVR